MRLTVISTASILALLVFAPTASANEQMRATHQQWLRVNDIETYGCTADPFSSTCPPVTSVVYEGPLNEGVPGEVPPVEFERTQDSAAASDDPLPVRDTPDVFLPYGLAVPQATFSHGDSGTTCAVNGERPFKMRLAGNPDVHVQANARNHCSSPATYHELTILLQRHHGSWENLASNWNSMSRPGEIFIRTYHRCLHRNFYNYRTEAVGYAVVQGRGYIAVNRSGGGLNCPENF